GSFCCVWSSVGGFCCGADDVFLFFFFSSRRRHTRLVSDWSSDVCSSDLEGGGTADSAVAPRLPVVMTKEARMEIPSTRFGMLEEIGRASCRERVEISGGAGSLKKKRGNKEERQEKELKRKREHEGGQEGN